MSHALHLAHAGYAQILSFGVSRFSLELRVKHETMHQAQGLCTHGLAGLEWSGQTLDLNPIEHLLNKMTSTLLLALEANSHIHARQI